MSTVSCHSESVPSVGRWEGSISTSVLSRFSTRTVALGRSSV